MDKKQTIKIVNPVSNVAFELLRENYGALSLDEENPLSLVSISSSSLSIDLWVGCPWQCVYCHVQGTVKNLDNKSKKMPNYTTLLTKHSIASVIKALVKHPLFIPTETIISIGTSCTEPFGSQKTIDEVVDVIREIQDNNCLENPIWIVTKAGIPKYFLDKIPTIISKSKALILTPTSGGLSREFEPMQNDRFLNIREAHEAGAKIVVYLRPLVLDWDSSPEKISKILETIRIKMRDTGPEAIVTGGLRWTSGIEYGLQLRNVPWPKSLKRLDDKKDIQDELLQYAINKSSTTFPDTPVFLHSSCALSYLLNKPDICLSSSRKKESCLSSICPKKQRDRCSLLFKKLDEKTLGVAKNKLKDLGISLSIQDLKDFVDSKLLTPDPIQEKVIERTLTECVIMK
ncbi:MAG: hypothetical protein LBI29_02455 [Rickettsiales bacterium]|jgi:DNA repair photolyase|nr:hypothetical protein [Rickettsiales bacterium]